MDEAMPNDETIDGFNNLLLLSMRGSQLSGNIPLWLNKLTNLEILMLQNNKLTGPLPTWISTLNSLFVLDISNNSLTGEIPNTLMDMQSLKSRQFNPRVFELPFYADRSIYIRVFSSFVTSLSLGNNNFTGVIPWEIGQLKALEVLSLMFNNLSGEIPQTICNLVNLQGLDLSNNHLTGEIPSGLKNLHFLGGFNVSNNDLEGPVPTGGQLDAFPSSSFDGNPKLCGLMLTHHCGSAEAPQEISTHEFSNKVIFAIAFGVFFGIGVLLDHTVLVKFIG